LFGLLPCALQCGDALCLVKKTVRAESEDAAEAQAPAATALELAQAH